ncbi:MAG: hypothetical protein QXT63_03935 [Thermoplasmata archaeon]
MHDEYNDDYNDEEYEDCSWEDVYRAFGCPITYDEYEEDCEDPEITLDNFEEY